MTDTPLHQTTEACPHCRNGWMGSDIECVNGVLIDIDVAHEGWQRDVEYPAAPCISKSGKWPKRDRGCQARLEEWAEMGRSAQTDDTIADIIRDVAEIERDPLPDQHPDEMRVTAAELRAILEERLANAR